MMKSGMDSTLAGEEEERKRRCMLGMRGEKVDLVYVHSSTELWIECWEVQTSVAGWKVGPDAQMKRVSDGNDRNCPETR